LNPRATKTDVKYLRFLGTKNGREEEKKFLLEGWRPLRDALASEFEVEAVYFVKSAEHNLKSMEAFIRKEKIPLRELASGELDQISATEQAQGVVTVLQQRNIPAREACTGAKLVVAVDAVSDPGNIGTIIRTADWFGVDAVLLGESSASLYNEKVIRSTAGSIFHIRIAERVELRTTLRELGDQGFNVWGTDSTGKSIGERKPEKLVLVFGSEANGISDTVKTVCKEIISIPLFGRAESLNVASACAAVLSYYRLSK
jgi:TrmH family RNA methyltransferase